MQYDSNLGGFESSLWRLVRENQPLPVPLVGTPEFFIWRRIEQFREAFTEILQTGSRRDGLPVFGDLSASEIHTREKGAIIFVENNTEEIVTGSVFPLLETITLSPGTIFPLVHDTPIGPSNRYLDAYVGLVKSEAMVLTTQIRPDPFEGARIFVYGDLNSQKMVTLFNAGERGASVGITFTHEPQVIAHGVSQIIAMPTALAGHVYFLSDDTNTTRVGPYALSHAGEITLSPRQQTTITVSAPTSGRIEGMQTLWVNGEFCSPNVVDLHEGENILQTADATPNNALFIPDGACYLQELTHWTPESLEKYGNL
jgi:hypothetical protein